MDEISAAQKRALIERVASSTLFSRTARLRDFLRYVGLTSLEAGAGEIHEQEIGEKVFGRTPDYDRGSDNIVRVNATELRKRIELYFNGDGRDEPIVFEIPRGGYALVFHRRVAEPATPLIELPPATPAHEIHPTTHGNGWKWATIVLAFLCVVLAWMLFRSRTQQIGTDRPAVMRFWRHFTRDGQATAQTDIVLSDESFSLIEDILRTSIPLTDYLDRSYVRTIDSSSLTPDRRADLNEILRHNLVTLGAVHAMRQITELPGLSQNFHITAPRFYPADSMNRNNAVFIGGKKSNPWTGFFDDQLNFTLDFDTTLSANFVANHHPLPGEPATYFGRGGPNIQGGVAIVAYLPNPKKTGDVLLIAGSDSDASAAAAEFVTSEESLQQLLKRFNRTDFPYFEVILKTTRLNGTSFTSEILGSRIH